MSESADEFKRLFECVEAMETMVADMKAATALFAAILLDIQDQSAKHRIVGPRGTHGYYSVLETTPPSSYSLTRIRLAFISPVASSSLRHPMNTNGEAQNRTLAPPIVQREGPLATGDRFRFV